MVSRWLIIFYVIGVHVEVKFWVIRKNRREDSKFPCLRVLGLNKGLHVSPIAKIKKCATNINP